MLESAWAIEERFAARDRDRDYIDPGWLARRTGPDRSEQGRGPGCRIVNGTAMLTLEGPLTKQAAESGRMAGGTSTREARAALRQAAEDPAVREIILWIDSPGGEVAGSFDLADEVARTAARKPVTAYVEDLCCSAAYAIASQASRIVANRSALIGALGAYLVVHDSSRAARNAGVDVHVVRSGRHKGAGVPGSAIAAEHLAALQQTVNELNRQLVQTVARGRGLAFDTVAELADGRVWVGAEALALGLIDAIGAPDDLSPGSIGSRSPAPGVRGTSLEREERDIVGLREAWAAFTAGFRAGGAEGDAAADAALADSLPTLDAPLPELDADQAPEIRRQLAELEEARSAAEADRRDSLLIGLKREGMLMPSAEEAARALIAADEAAFTAFVAKQGRLVAFARPEDRPRAGEPNGDAVAGELQGSEAPYQTLDRLARQIAAAEQAVYHVAFARACARRPDLAAAHIEAERSRR